MVQNLCVDLVLFPMELGIPLEGPPSCPPLGQKNHGLCMVLLVLSRNIMLSLQFFPRKKHGILPSKASPQVASGLPEGEKVGEDGGGENGGGRRPGCHLSTPRLTESYST